MNLENAIVQKKALLNKIQNKILKFYMEIDLQFLWREY